MRVYLAARYGRRQELLACRDHLLSLGHEVTSRWLWEEHDLPIGADPALGGKFALDDWEDINNADCVIAFTEEPGKPASGRARGGRHVEFGIALARQSFLGIGVVRLIVVGWRENVFHYLPGVEFYPTWIECIEDLRGETCRGKKP